ncbi:MAG TPA: hypothetical protein VIA62_02210 [Thermoanaerobaculia bacterium]|nr:hypothetical protein [Thermoanaerobaculia bacterium]
MALFNQAGFEKGDWAGALATRLRGKYVLPGRKPKARLYRYTWTQWVQIEPSGYSGPTHWFGKPAVVADIGALYAGYYIERGIDHHERPEYVITPEWHWYSLRACIDKPAVRHEIDAVMQEVPPERRKVAASCRDQYFEPAYEGETTLLAFRRFVDECPPGEWVNGYLGARFEIDECLTQQEKLVGRLVSPLQLGAEIERIVLRKRDAEHDS